MTDITMGDTEDGPPEVVLLGDPIGIAEVFARGAKTIPVMLSCEEAEAAIYALRVEAHRQEPDEYPLCRPVFPGYDPWPSDMARTADYLEKTMRDRGLVGPADDMGRPGSAPGGPAAG